MKKIFLLITIMSLIIIQCGNKTDNQTTSNNNVNTNETVQSNECRTLAAGHGITVKLKPIKYYTPAPQAGSRHILNPDLIPEVVFEICDTSRHLNIKGL
ncbi:hypothetical protein BFL38_00575 [Brachyspira hampsonii]|uniref:Uncharacterized protein n=1 Tax=Brachyspira hampsonii TaxID=1287055 RepID=A0A1E5NAA2_9SPIR|nr:hypothetical protein BFL38_00575 [Brachyspira hampsonii]